MHTDKKQRLILLSVLCASVFSLSYRCSSVTHRWLNPLRVLLRALRGSNSSYLCLSIDPNPCLLVLFVSETLLLVRLKCSFPPSATILPRSPAISSRFVPGYSPVLAMKCPTAPFVNSIIADTSSSVSIG